MELAEIQQEISSSPAVLIYFYNDACAPCQVLRPKVKELVQHSFPRIKEMYIHAAAEPETTAHFEVFSAPTLLVYFEGKEYIRESKNISISELESKISRYYEMIFGS
jgi:thioredoxin 1